MKKLLLLFAVLLSTLSGWAQVYQKVPHAKWTVTALNEARVQGNEGGVAFLKDEDPSTFWHSDYSDSYSDGTSEKKKGQDGLQCFMVDMAEVCSFDRITYAGRSNGDNNWATKVRVYAFEELPSGWPMAGDTHKALSALTYTEKEDLLKKENNTVLGTPIFDNNNAAWASDQNIKTIDFAEAKSGRYILFVADATSSTNGYLTCSDFNLWQKIEDIVEDKPYFFKLTNIAGADESEWYLDTNTPIGDTSGKKTIGKSETKTAATYFTLHDGYWYISTLPGALADFVSVDCWCATPLSEEPTPWLMEKNNDGTISLRQYIWEPGYLGGNQIISGSGENSSKVYTNQGKAAAVKLELVDLTSEELQNESSRVPERKKQLAAEKARTVLGYKGVGYPAEDSEARTILQAAIDADDATYESICEAIVVYQSSSQTVLLPEAGKVYRLVSASPTFGDKKVVYSDNTELKWQSKNEASMNQLWTVESINGMNLSLMNVGDAAYSQVSGFTNPVRTLPAKNESSLTFLGKGQFRVMCNKLQSMHANGNGNGANASGNIINSNGGLDSYSAWYFEEVAVTKAILAAQINSIKTAYLGSLLLKSEGVVGLQEAVDVAQAVHDANGNYAEAFSTLVAAVKSATFEYIDLGYFYMKAKSSGSYAYNEGNGLKAKAGKTINSILKFSKSSNGKYYIQCANGLYAQNVAQSTQTSINTTQVEYVIRKISDSHYVLRPYSSIDSYQFMHHGTQNYDQVVGWLPSSDNSQWVFEALSDEELEKIYTVNFVTYDASHYLSYKKDYSGDKVVKQDGGFYVLDTEPSESDFEQVGVTDPYLAKVLLYTENKNIRFTTGVNGENIYVIKCLAGNKYARYNSGITSNGNNMLSNQSDLLQESLFYLEEGTGDFSGFYAIRSVAAPTLYAYNLGTSNNDSRVAMKAAPAEGLTKEYYWKITYRDENGNPANITPYHEGGTTGDNYGWNKRGGDDNNHIGYWYDVNQDCNSKNDNKWYVRTIEEELTALGKIPLPEYTVDNSVIGLATYESVYPYIGLDEIINSTGLNLLKNSTSTTYKVVAPKVGSFLRLKNEKSSKYMYGNKTTIKITDDAKANELPSTIFYLDKNNTLLSYVDGCYLDCEKKGYSAVGTANAGEFNIAYGGAKENVIVYKNNGVYTFGGATSGVGPDNIDKGSGYNENGYNWIVEGVASLPFTFKKAALGFATFNAPVAVQLPAGVLAYITDMDETKKVLQMCRIEGNEIPANTPVMLYNEAAKAVDAEDETTIDLLIVDAYTGDEEVEIKSKNDFYGTVEAETYPANETVYSLQKKQKEQDSDPDMVGFYQKASGTTLGGFKAWIKTATASARAFTIIFDGDDATGLKEALGLENENVEIYDLSGRRLDKPAKGVNVIGGKLVIK